MKRILQTATLVSLIGLAASGCRTPSITTSQNSNGLEGERDVGCFSGVTLYRKDNPIQEPDSSSDYKFIVRAEGGSTEMRERVLDWYMNKYSAEPKLHSVGITNYHAPSWDVYLKSLTEQRTSH